MIVDRREGTNIKVLEQFIEGKQDVCSCEDCCFISDDFIAVIDGVTSKSDFRHEGKTTGRLAAELTCAALEVACRESTLSQVLDNINANINGFYDTYNFPYNRKEKGLQAACVIYSVHHRQLWMIGDCQASVDDTLYLNPKKSDNALASMRSLVIESLMQDNPSLGENFCAEQARAFILPWILKASQFANSSDTSYGYAVLNGEPIPQELLISISIPEGNHEIILTSDGYPIVEKTLALTEHRLKEVLDEDPCCYKSHPSTKGLQQGQKSFDDRTYIRFST